jgi:lipopolysaccharide export LptBFGC system permease protein LptF
MRDECKNIQEFIEYLDKDTSLAKGWDVSWDYEYNQYKRHRERKPTTPQDEILEFERYRRDRLEHSLKWPDIMGTLEVEEAKIKYKDIIDRYPFLHVL